MSNTSNTVCPVYLSSMLNNTFRKLIHNPCKIFGEYVKPGQTAADIGCGPGYFSVALAEMVGEEGRVLCVDLQPEMLAQVKANAERLNLQSRIVLTQSQSNNLNIEQKVDFVLAFWMVHEVPDTRVLFDNIVSILKPNGLFMMIEPKGHTSAEQFQTEIVVASEAGLKMSKVVKVSISRGILFSHPEP